MSKKERNKVTIREPKLFVQPFPFSRLSKGRIPFQFRDMQKHLERGGKILYFDLGLDDDLDFIKHFKDKLND